MKSVSVDNELLQSAEMSLSGPDGLAKHVLAQGSAISLLLGLRLSMPLGEQVSAQEQVATIRLAKPDAKVVDTKLWHDPQRIPVGEALLVDGDVESRGHFLSR